MNVMAPVGHAACDIDHMPSDSGVKRFYDEAYLERARIVQGGGRLPAELAGILQALIDTFHSSVAIAVSGIPPRLRMTLRGGPKRRLGES
jgi:hypothetical protein